MVSKDRKRRQPTPDELEAIKEKLLQRKKELWQGVIEDLENDVKNEHQELIQTIREEGDVALEELRMSTAFSLIELKHQELQKIEEALRRIEAGEYGRCVDCGHWIRPARLEFVPCAIRCRECQQEWEKISRD